MKTNLQVQVTAKVERIRFPKADTIESPLFVPQTFYILACDIGVCKGKLDHLPKVGETLVLDGKWELSQYNGQSEFVFFHAKTFVPVDKRSLLRYACELTPGFGPAMEERIWAECGELWEGLSLSHDIRGLTPSKLEAFHKTVDFLQLNQDRAKAVAWLTKIGLTLKMAEAAFAKWGGNTVSHVENDPYILATLPNYGFSDADTHIRDHFQIERNDSRRVTAALKYYIAQLSQEDTAVKWDDIFAKVTSAIDSDPQLISDTCRAMFASGSLVAFPRSERITSVRDFTNEAAIYKFANESGWATVKTKAKQPKGRDFDLDETQMGAVQFALDRKFAIINGGAGCGKCLGKGTPVIMYDMTVKNVEDIRVGDILLGPNGEKKHVTSTTTDREEMFRITPKRGGQAFTCNKSHILSVLHTRKRIRDYTDDAKKCFNISVEDIITKLKPTQREHLKCWHSDCINRPIHDVPVDPYFLGVWLGDGASSKGVIRISNSDKEIIDWLCNYAEQSNLKSRIRPGYFKHTCPLVEIYSPLGRGIKKSNPLVKAMSQLNLWENKHIPHCYIDNDIDVRLSLLAGLLDADGYFNNGTYDIVQKSECLANDIAFLARSLGFGVSIKSCRKQCCNNGVWGNYFRVIISGDIDRIPCIVERKKAKPRRQVKNPRIHGITIESIGEGEYYGFTLAEEDGLFLLGDFTVTHNTTIIKAICDSLKGDIRLCAFAGKAAARLREATMHPATTIHRMLGWMGDGNGFAVKTLSGVTVILDEASMVSSDLLAEIVKRNPDRLVLVGDEAQLPPVGSGQPFHDLVHLLPDCVRTLTTCYRSREAVLSSALAIREGNIPPNYTKSYSEFYEFISLADARKAHDFILRQVKNSEIDFADDVILCCRNGDSEEEPLSVKSLNADIKALVNPGDGKIDTGDRIICTVNSSDLDVWNGTTGRCACFDSSRAMWVELDFPNADGETSVLIPKDKVKDWQLAYALTVHKSQGSQYGKVFFAVARRDSSTLLSRSMVYTAVTRAKKECHVVGDAWAFGTSIREVRTKHTAMQEIYNEQHS